MKFVSFTTLFPVRMGKCNSPRPDTVHFIWRESVGSTNVCLPSKKALFNHHKCHVFTFTAGKWWVIRQEESHLKCWFVNTRQRGSAASVGVIVVSPTVPYLRWQSNHQLFASSISRRSKPKETESLVTRKFFVVQSSFESNGHQLLQFHGRYVNTAKSFVVRSDTWNWRGSSELSGSWDVINNVSGGAIIVLLINGVIDSRDDVPRVADTTAEFNTIIIDTKLDEEFRTSSTTSSRTCWWFINLVNNNDRCQVLLKRFLLKRVWGHCTFMSVLTRTTPSAIFMIRSTSPPKSRDLVSMMLIRVRYSTAALYFFGQIVIPHSFSRYVWVHCTLIKLLRSSIVWSFQQFISKLLF